MFFSFSFFLPVILLLIKQSSTQEVFPSASNCVLDCAQYQVDGDLSSNATEVYDQCLRNCDTGDTESGTGHESAKKVSPQASSDPDPNCQAPPPGPPQQTCSNSPALVPDDAPQCVKSCATTLSQQGRCGAPGGSFSPYFMIPFNQCLLARCGPSDIAAGLKFTVTNGPFGRQMCPPVCLAGGGRLRALADGTNPNCNPTSTATAPPGDPTTAPNSTATGNDTSTSMPPQPTSAPNSTDVGNNTTNSSTTPSMPQPTSAPNSTNVGNTTNSTTTSSMPQPTSAPNSTNVGNTTNSTTTSSMPQPTSAPNSTNVGNTTNSTTTSSMPQPTSAPNSTNVGNTTNSTTTSLRPQPTSAPNSTNVGNTTNSTTTSSMPQPTSAPNSTNVGNTTNRTTTSSMPQPTSAPNSTNVGNTTNSTTTSSMSQPTSAPNATNVGNTTNNTTTSSMPQPTSAPNSTNMGNTTNSTTTSSMPSQPTSAPNSTVVGNTTNSTTTSSMPPQPTSAPNSTSSGNTTNSTASPIQPCTTPCCTAARQRACKNSTAQVPDGAPECVKLCAGIMVQEGNCSSPSGSFSGSFAIPFGQCLSTRCAAADVQIGLNFTVTNGPFAKQICPEACISAAARRLMPFADGTGSGGSNCTANSNATTNSTTGSNSTTTGNNTSPMPPQPTSAPNSTNVGNTTNSTTSSMPSQPTSAPNSTNVGNTTNSTTSSMPSQPTLAPNSTETGNSTNSTTAPAPSQTSLPVDPTSTPSSDLPAPTGTPSTSPTVPSATPTPTSNFPVPTTAPQCVMRCARKKLEENYCTSPDVFARAYLSCLKDNCNAKEANIGQQFTNQICRSSGGTVPGGQNPGQPSLVPESAPQCVKRCARRKVEENYCAEPDVFSKVFLRCLKDNCNEKEVAIGQQFTNQICRSSGSGGKVPGGQTLVPENAPQCVQRCARKKVEEKYCSQPDIFAKAYLQCLKDHCNEKEIRTGLQFTEQICRSSGRTGQTYIPDNAPQCVKMCARRKVEENYCNTDVFAKAYLRCLQDNCKENEVRIGQQFTNQICHSSRKSTLTHNRVGGGGPRAPTENTMSPIPLEMPQLPSNDTTAIPDPISPSTPVGQGGSASHGVNNSSAVFFKPPVFFAMGAALALISFHFFG